MGVRVALVDDHQLIREGLRRALERTGDAGGPDGIEVVAEAASVAEGVAVVEHRRPDVVVIDLNLAGEDGLDLVRRLRADSNRIGLVVLTMYDGDENLLAALEAGASAFVLKSASTDDVLAAVRHAVASPLAFSAVGLADVMRRRLTGEGRVRLTEREREVLELLRDGLPVATIARRLFISLSTCKNHVSRVYEKLGASNRTAAVMAALKLGLIDQDGTRYSA